MNTLLSELGAFGARMATLRSILLHLALFLAFSIWIPRMKGIDFLDSPVLAAYACLALFFAAPATAQALANTKMPPFSIAKARILVGLLYGEVVTLVLLGGGIATVYWLNRGSFVPTPDWPVVGKSVLFGLSAAALLASFAAFLTVRFSRREAIIGLRLAYFGLLVLFFYRGQSLPSVGVAGAAVCLALASLVVGLLKRVCA